MLIGYMRVSSVDERHTCIQDRASGVRDDRPGLRGLQGRLPRQPS